MKAQIKLLAEMAKQAYQQNTLPMSPDATALAVCHAMLHCPMNTGTFLSLPVTTPYREQELQEDKIHYSKDKS